MKKLLMGVMGLVFVSASYAAGVSINLAGTYLCDGYDSHSGAFKGATMVLILDSKNSELPDGHGAYRYSLVTSGDLHYTGVAASSGNTVAITFQNTGYGQGADHGISTGFVTYDQNANGMSQTVLHNFYYEPEYYGGGNGSDTCVKQ